MTKAMRASALLAVLALSTANATQLTPEEKMNDFNTMISTIEAGYGPLQYKKNAFGIELQSLKASYVDKVRKSKTNGDYYYLVTQFVADYHDSHFAAFVPTSHNGVLGFTTDLVDGKVLIDQKIPFLLPSSFNFDRGDEIVEMDGKPIADVLNGLKKYRGMGFDQSELRLAARFVTMRPGRYMPVPKGITKLKIRRGTSTIIEEASLRWISLGRPLDESAPMEAPASSGLLGGSTIDYDQLSLIEFWKDALGDQYETSYQCSGSTRVAMPQGAKVIMTKPFVAYYYPTPKGNIGYLRIPHYSPSDHNLRFAQYEYAVNILEKNTKALVIDQDHNCGGSVSFLHRLVGLFMQKEYPEVQFQLLANKREYLAFSQWASRADRHTLDFHYFQNTVDMIKKAWQDGKFMTDMTSISGRPGHKPNSINYTKPILMLIDEMSGSGGDAFPAMLQGLGRAKLLGTRTMGAGGHVEQQPNLPYSQIGMVMTKSLFYRPDGVAVENNGASPDISYTISRDDFVYGFKNYRDFYTTKAMEMIQ